MRFTPRTMSAAVTSRAGVVSHCTPERRVIVYVLPSVLMPWPGVGRLSAMSGTAVVVFPSSAG